MSSRKIFSVLEGEQRIELFGRESGDLEIHMDGAWGFTYVNGACKINLYTVAPTSEENYERREVVARITMPPPMLFAMRDYLDQQCKRLEEKGIVLPPEQITEKATEHLSKEMAEQLAKEGVGKLPAPEKSEN